MSYMDQRERSRQAERAREKADKLRVKQLQGDIQALMQQPAMRRVLAEFLRYTGLDGSPFNTNAMAQSHGIGRQDAGRWWIDLVRDHCPEQEVVMRTEAAAEAQLALADDEEAEGE